MRLIDADLAAEQFVIYTGSELFEPYEAAELLDRVPTAYDVDKIVEQIKKSPTDEDGIICSVDGKPVISKEKAIEIIKAGGVNEQSITNFI